MGKKVDYRELGLTDKEYQLIVETLGREPNDLELEMYGVMWSEHCSYKNSKPMLKRFPTRGKRVIQGPGENAGIVDIDDGQAVVMKIESHNHPSAIEPYQGAATGVGGIIRDIFTMGARPIALLDSLRFGELKSERVKHLFSGVVSGIADYGNCMGIPTVGGEVYFESCYTDNPLVNAMCVGIVNKKDIVRGKASGVGNPVMIVGALTGRDGIHGASFASEELSEDSEEKRPAVQVGDPFMEKLLLEACLEILKSGCVVGIQDLGAAGLTSASCETASRAGNGIELDVSLVPRREEGMTPREVMLSESQERMLVIVKKGRENEIEEIFRKWDLAAVTIGRVTDDGFLRVKDGDRVVAELPVKSLAEGAPTTVNESKQPAYIKDVQRIQYDQIPVPEDFNEVFLKLLASENICSREWIYRQYDHMVRTNTLVLPGADAAVLRIKGTKKGIALTTDCNGRYCYLNPLEGGRIAVAEAARNLVCVGAEPLAATDCLNFGNPKKPGVYWQFENCIEGMSQACEALNTPVISGNVSFYNESKEKAVYPTPVVGMVGLIRDINKIVTPGFKKEGDLIAVIGENHGGLDGSEYLRVIHGRVAGNPSIDLEKEKAVQKCCLEATKQGILNSAHDVSEGGLLINIAESCIKGGVGARIELDSEGKRWDEVLFGEAQSRIVVSLSEHNCKLLEKISEQVGCKVLIIGKVAGKKLIARVDGSTLVKQDVAEISRKWRERIKCLME